jgi:hypothetical protein
VCARSTDPGCRSPLNGHTLWLPMTIDVLTGVIAVHVAWPQAGIAERAMVIPVEELRMAAHAILRT